MYCIYFELLVVNMHSKTWVISSKPFQCDSVNKYRFHTLHSSGRFNYVSIQARSQGGGSGGSSDPPPKWPNSTRSQDNPRIIIKGPKIWPIWPPPQNCLATGLLYAIKLYDTQLQGLTLRCLIIYYVKISILCKYYVKISNEWTVRER